MKFRGANGKPLVVQLQRLLASYPGSSGKIARSKLFWKCRLQPQSITATYLIQVEYRLGRKPVVYVSEGKLACEKDLNIIPHHFEVFDDGRVHVCLDKYDWNSNMLLAESIVPWAMEWAIYYEIWLVTGVWHADEVPHGTGGLKNLD